MSKPKFKVLCISESLRQRASTYTNKTWREFMDHKDSFHTKNANQINYFVPVQ